MNQFLLRISSVAVENPDEAYLRVHEAKVRATWRPAR